MRQVRTVLALLSGAMRGREAALVRVRSGRVQGLRRVRAGMPASCDPHGRGDGPMTAATDVSRAASNKPRSVVCEGNEAAAIGVALSRPDVVAVYPITPQSSLVEHLSQMIADGRLKADLMNVEGEHEIGLQTSVGDHLRKVFHQGR